MTRGAKSRSLMRLSMRPVKQTEISTTAQGRLEIWDPMVDLYPEHKIKELSNGKSIADLKLPLCTMQTIDGTVLKGVCVYRHALSMFNISRHGQQFLNFPTCQFNDSSFFEPSVSHHLMTT